MYKLGCEKLLRKFLVRDPLRRAGLEIVTDDVWINDGHADSPITTDLGEQIDEDDKIVALMATKYQVPKDDVLKSLRENLYNDIAATYYLLYHEKEVRTQVQAEVERGEVLASPFVSASPTIRTKTAHGSGDMNRINEDEVSNDTFDVSKTPTQKPKSSTLQTRQRRATISVESGKDAASPAVLKKSDEKKEEKKKSSKTDSQEIKASKTNSKTDIAKNSGGSSPNGSPSNSRVDRKRNNTIVGILRDKIQRPAQGLISPTADKGNGDVVKSGIFGSGTVDSNQGSIVLSKGEENKPRSLRFTFNSNSTSTKDPEVIISEVLKACNKLAVTHKLTSKFVVECAWNNPASSKETTKLEIEICKLPRLNNLHGLRFKRIAGSSSDYKELCEKLLQTIHL